MANYLNVLSGTRAQTPDQVGLAVGTTTLDVRCEVAPDSWAVTGKFPILVDQQNRFQFYYNPAGTLELDFIHTGSVTSFAVSTVATGFSAGSRNWVRALRNVAAGTCDFYTSTDGSAWTALGTQVTGLNTTTENAAGGAVVSAGWDGNAGDVYVGKVYTTRILVNGATIINMDWTTAAVGAGPWVSGTGETWTAANAVGATVIADVVAAARNVAGWVTRSGGY